MSPRRWTLLYICCALLGVLGGYIATLIYKPSLIPPAFRISGLRQPTNILFLGTDVVYEGRGRKKKVLGDSFKGRSDTLMVARIDPFRNSIVVLSIPRDTRVSVPGHGKQKINSANAYGGIDLVKTTVQDLLNIDIDHYVVLNLKGVEALIDDLGGITVEVPKRMRYTDKAANLRINLKPGRQKLDGKQAIGFVRFRHDQLGDIGRVQRQEIFIKAVLEEAMKPESWVLIPKLVETANQFMKSDLSVAELTSYAAFVKDIPKENQVLMMLPGTFSEQGDWLISKAQKREILSRFMGSSFISHEKDRLRITLINMSSKRSLARSVRTDLKEIGYKRIRLKKSKRQIKGPLERSRIIAQKGNIQEAKLLKQDLGGAGEIVNASVGDIESSITVFLGEDLIIGTKTPDK